MATTTPMQALGEKTKKALLAYKPKMDAPVIADIAAKQLLSIRTVERYAKEGFMGSVATGQRILAQVPQSIEDISNRRLGK